MGGKGSRAHRPGRCPLDLTRDERAKSAKRSRPAVELIALPAAPIAAAVSPSRRKPTRRATAGANQWHIALRCSASSARLTGP